MATAPVNGQQIAVDDTGGDGPVVLLGHGFLMDRSMFAPQVDALRDSHRVITWDQRGFGDTLWDGQPYTYWDLASDTLGLLDTSASRGQSWAACPRGASSRCAWSSPLRSGCAG
ncbi:MAG: alpha/beta fold hydrolase [Acidimicrobiales bacterium]|jgi:3-oxoadipate enol-lactonase